VPAQTAAAEEMSSVAVQDIPVEQAPAFENQATETQATEEHQPRERKERGKREPRGRPDRFSDARGAEDRARKTRRNPHGIAEMDIGDNVVAFGGFTPAFLLVDPYGGKGVPPETAVVEDEAEEPQDQTPASTLAETQTPDDSPIEHAAATE
jgi:hypothetical protein